MILALFKIDYPEVFHLNAPKIILPSSRGNNAIILNELQPHHVTFQPCLAVSNMMQWTTRESSWPCC